jgi:glutamate synthase (NADPH/NADH) small chain
MERSKPSYQPKETRVSNLREVSLGLTKKIAQDEARRCPQCAVATCLPGCPLGIDIPGFIRFLREGDTLSALECIKKENPFPDICGRICPAPCEVACIFHADGAPIAIGDLERFAADGATSKVEKQTVSIPGPTKVAIIGCGPAGMSAAYYLAKANLSVTVFEAAHEPGGVLRYVIPEFRLPQQVLDVQLARLRSMGVEIQTDVVFGRTMMMDELFMRGFSALLLATGASLPVFSYLPGSSLGHVYYDVEFLNGLQNINKEDVLQRAARQKRGFPAKTVILGAGPAAFDAARMSVRLGSQADVVFAGLEEQLGVSEEILKESSQEGIRVHSMQALEILGDDNGFVRGVKCRKLDMVEGDRGLKLQASLEEPVILEAQCVIMANGHAAPKTGQATSEKVFACGQLVNAGGSVADAIASGKSVAQKIIEYLGKS